MNFWSCIDGRWLKADRAEGGGIIYLASDVLRGGWRHFGRKYLCVPTEKRACKEGARRRLSVVSCSAIDSEVTLCLLSFGATEQVSESHQNFCQCQGFIR